MNRMRALMLACGVMAAACGADSGGRAAAGAWRVVAEVAMTGDEAADAAAVRAAVAAHGPAALVALTEAGRQAAATARSELPIVAIAAAPAAAPAVHETIVVEATGAVAAVDLALLACHGLPLPPQIAVGTRTLTAANAAAGGAPRLAPGDLGLEMLRRQHPDVITTAPRTDVVFRIGFVQIRSDRWHDRVGDEVQAVVKRHPQLQLVHHVAGGQSARLRGQINECLQANLRVVLVATDDWAAVQPVVAAAAERRIALIGLDALAEAQHTQCSVGADQAILGRAAGEALRGTVPGGGSFVVLHGDPATALTKRRHQGLVDALGLQAK